ncbi:MAG: hypothetical protein ABJC26_03375, partial [Gemmatimonadaceae bacterium]
MEAREVNSRAPEPANRSDDPPIEPGRPFFASFCVRVKQLADTVTSEMRASDHQNGDVKRFHDLPRTLHRLTYATVMPN